MSYKGRKNQYDCQKCGKSIITIDRDEGVTPFQIECRATEGCEGDMYSHFYNINQRAIPTFEWIIPTDDQIEADMKRILGCYLNTSEPANLLAIMKEWIATGHLMLFPIPDLALQVEVPTACPEQEEARND